MEIYHNVNGISVSEYRSSNIFILHDILNEEECNKFKLFIDSMDDFKEKRTICQGNNVECYSVHMDNLKKNPGVIINIPLLKIVTEYDKKMFDIIHQTLETLKHINPYLKCDADSGYELRKVFGKTKLHIDSIKSSNGGYVGFVRCMSIIIALNDNFTGGEYNFPYHNIRVKIKQGSIIVFPPYWTHPHEVTSIGKNQLRYTISTWVLENF
jgi:hypothetical protein